MSGGKTCGESDILVSSTGWGPQPRHSSYQRMKNMNFGGYKLCAASNIRPAPINKHSLFQSSRQPCLHIYMHSSIGFGVYDPFPFEWEHTNIQSDKNRYLDWREVSLLDTPQQTLASLHRMSVSIPCFGALLIQGKLYLLVATKLTERVKVGIQDQRKPNSSTATISPQQSSCYSWFNWLLQIQTIIGNQPKCGYKEAFQSRRSGIFVRS